MTINWKRRSKLLLSSAIFNIAFGTSALALDQDTLQAQLDSAEKNYKDGKVEVAIKEATGLLGTREDGVFRSDRVAFDAKADLVVFQLKAGHPDESARLLREMLIVIQMASPMDPRYSKAPAVVLAEAPKFMKDTFATTVLTRLNEKADTKAIIDSLIDNTVPKDYADQLTRFCATLNSVSKPLDEFKTIADCEELKYGDHLSSIDSNDEDAKNDPLLNETKLSKAGVSLNQLAGQAAEMPVGDLRSALYLYRLALAENCAQRYPQAETFARDSLRQAKRLTEDMAGLGDIQIALAYALVKQGKKDEFKILKDEFLKNVDDDRDRQLFAMARLTEAAGDSDGAIAIYKRALGARKKRGNTQQPEWIDCYNSLLQKVAPN